MNVSLQNIDKVSAELTVKLEKADYQEKVDKELKSLRQKAQIPGFRKGMVPTSLIKKMYGKSVIAEVVNKALQEAVYNYIKYNKVNMLGEPLPNEEKQQNIDFDTMEEFDFVFDIALAPEFKAEVSAKDKVDYYSIEVSEEMIDNQVKMYTQRTGKYDKVDAYEDNDMLKGLLAQLDEEGNTKEGGIQVEAAVLMPAYMKNDDISTKQLMRYVKGPDFPTGGIVVNKDDLFSIYETGTGKIKVRGKVEVEEIKGGKKRLIISEIPYTMIGAGIGKFLNDVCALVESKKTSDIVDISNQSSKEGIRIVIDLKKGADTENLTNMLYKKTRLEDTFGVNMLAVADGRPETMGLKRIIEYHVDFQFELATRKYKNLLAKEKDKKEIQEGLIKACDVIDLIIEILRGSQSVKDAISASKYSFYIGFNEIICITDVELRSTGESLPNFKYIQEDLLKYLKLCDIPHTEQYLNIFYLNVLQLHGDRSLATNKFLELYYYLSNALNQEFTLSETVLSDEIIRRLTGCTNLEDIKGFFSDYLREVIQEIGHLRTNKSQKFIEKAKEYIRQNYAHDISLESIADEIGLSACYLSTLYKNIEKTSIKEYLIDVRIDASKKYLQDINLKIYEVAANVGYTDSRYFSQLFRKKTGYTPGQYREFIQET